MLTVGEKAPLFAASSTEGDLDLASFLSGGPVVVYFFPRAFTPG